MKIRLVEDFILVKLIEKTISKGGIILPKAKEAKVKHYEILQLGPEVENDDLKVGDTLLVHMSAGVKIEDLGYIIREENIYAIVEED